MSKETRPYIARGGEHAWRALSAFKKVHLHGFAVKANKQLVHEMLTRYIGEPSEDLGLHIDVRGTSLNYVLFLFIDSERRQDSGGHDKSFRGGHSEQLFAVVTLGYRLQPNPSWILFAPYVFAADTPGWTADREIYGYPRQLADVSIGVDENGLPTYSVSARVIKRFGRTENSEDCQIIRIKKKSNAEGARIEREAIAEKIVGALDAANVTLFDRFIPRVVAKVQRGATEAERSFFARRPAGAKWKRPDSATGFTSLMDQLESHSIPMLFLKQFRDITYADRACYQAVLEASFQLGKAIEGSLATDYELYLEHADSVPIGRECGIPTGRPVPVDFGFQIDFDEMRLKPANVISNPYWNPGVEFSTIEEPSRLPMYVDRGGEAVWRQPSKLSHARIFGFGVQVPAEQQQTLLNTFVNDVVDESNSTYGSKKLSLRACDGVDLVMLLFVDYKRIASGDPNDRQLGGATYREFLLMQLAISDDPEFPELNWFIPYICLDRDAPRLGGREIFGYPKQLARIPEFQTFPVPGGAIEPARTLTVQATVFSKSNSTKAGHDVPIVSVTSVNGPPRITPFHGAEDMLLELFKRSHSAHDPAVRRVFPVPTTAPGSDGSVGPGVEVLNALLFTGIGNVFLKEFRDSLDPTQACYQAVCKTDTIPATFHGGGRVDSENYRIRIANVASEPLRTILKESGLNRDVVIPQFAYMLNLDLELTAGRVIANPMATDASPDVSLKCTATKAKEDGQPSARVRRVASSAEPFWRRVGPRGE